jgi:hypothetical protein
MAEKSKYGKRKMTIPDNERLLGSPPRKKAREVSFLNRIFLV